MNPIELAAAIGFVTCLFVFGLALVHSFIERNRKRVEELHCEILALRQDLKSDEQRQAERKLAAARRAGANQLLGPGSEY